jgi:hypothetical protein
MSLTNAQHAILEDLRRAYRKNPHAGWVHKHILQAEGGARVSARVGELVAMGWKITSRTISGNGGAEYRLESLERGAPREVRVSFDLPRDMIAALARGELPAEVIDEARKVCPSEQRSLFGGER